MISYEQVEGKILSIREQNVILDSSVAELYGVETKRINEAVANNPDKFPEGYLIDLTKDEYQALKSKISTLKSLGRGQHSKYLPKAFSEKGLYMLATILKSPGATETTIAIVETFAKIRELSKSINELSVTTEKGQQKALMQRTGELLTEVLDDSALEITGDETTIEINLAFVKIKRAIKRSRKKNQEA
jgi:hypothetical protein